MQRAATATNAVLFSAEARISDAEQMQLQSASDNLLRMTRITSSLRHCGEIARATSWDVVDCATLVDRVAEGLGGLLEETGSRVTRHALPKIYSIESVLLLVFQELFVNAVNNRAADPLHIRVDASPGEEGVEFTVSDNGIGIDRRHWTAIFNPFFTVDPRAWRPGLGLSVARLGVEHLGGRIHLDTSSRSGTAFRVSLPGPIR